MADKIVAIHQPNFFPWLGYFDKIDRSDVFILMDNVQFPKTSRGCWCNRVKLLVNKDARWVTAPVDRSYHGIKLIKDMYFKANTAWREKIIKTLENNYRKASNFKDKFPVISALIACPIDNIAEYNTFVIKSLCELLEIDTSKIILGSELEIEGCATDLLIAMTKAVGGTTYICGAGANGYQEDWKFATAGLKIVYQNFQHPYYRQVNRNQFIPGLSVIDYIFNGTIVRM
jgi:hypothetical protein